VIDTVLFFVHYALLLFFGITLSVAFSGVRPSKNAVYPLISLFAACAVLQILVFVWLGEDMTWKLYPLITHVPIGITLCFVFRKRITTVLAAIASAYLCCQPANWIGLLSDALFSKEAITHSAQIISLLTVGFLVLRYFALYISELYNKENRNVLIFGSIPLVYYLFDYIMGIYTDFWHNNNRVAAEFLPFFLCIVFMIFCIIYYKEYEQKADAERKEQIIRITAEQQEKEIASIRKSNLETRLLRHDMRLLLNNLALSIEQEDKETSLKLISGYVSNVDAASLHRYCGNDTINYVLTNFEQKCHDSEVKFVTTVSLDELKIDEILFSSILSNALDNALNAQLELPPVNREIKLLLKISNGKLLLSVSNPFRKAPAFANGLPLTDKKGHGYGTQSIRYMTERLGGKCQFILQNDKFILRVII